MPASPTPLARLQPGMHLPRIITRPDGTRYVAIPKAAPPENRASPGNPLKPPVKRGFRLHPSLRRGQRTVRKDANPHYPITTKPSARASRRSVVRNNPTLARPRLTPYQKDLKRKRVTMASAEPQTPSTNEPPPVQPADSEHPASGSEPDPTAPSPPAPSDADADKADAEEAKKAASE